MPKYRFFASKCYEIEIEADNEEQAFDVALETPIEEWQDKHQTEYGVDLISNEVDEDV